MEQAKKDRISELTRIARERTLTEAETAERQALRREYLAEWRLGAEQTLENVYIDDGRGNIRKLHKKG